MTTTKKPSGLAGFSAKAVADLNEKPAELLTTPTKSSDELVAFTVRLKRSQKRALADLAHQTETTSQDLIREGLMLVYQKRGLKWPD